jgi:N-acetylglutamate synthase-like GNAT family acetyltransferase
MMDLRLLEADEIPRIVAFYEETGHLPKLNSNDQFLVAEERGGIRAAVRLCRESGSLVLRGMRVSRLHQRQGLGSRLLQYAEEAMGSRGCYCIPFTHLESFYAQIGFVRIDPERAPAFLRNRLEHYRREHELDVILMRRPGSYGAGAVERNAGFLQNKEEGAA